MADTIQPHPNNPRTVDLQRARNLVVLYDGGVFVQGDPWAGWSLVRMTWCGMDNQVGIRWNGAGTALGAPTEAGRPAWFILPVAVGEILAQAVSDHLSGDVEEPTLRLRRSVANLLSAARAAHPEDVARLTL